MFSSIFPTVSLSEVNCETQKILKPFFANLEKICCGLCVLYPQVIFGRTIIALLLKSIDSAFISETALLSASTLL